MSKVYTADDIRAILGRLSELVRDEKDRLTELDAQLGDGDLGLTMVKGFSNIAVQAAASEETDIGKMLMQAGMTMAKTVPSTMGTLLATGFLRGGKATAGVLALDADGLIGFLAAFTGGIMERGKSGPGEKTIVDALVPALERAREARTAGKSMDVLLSEANQAALEGAENTKNMTARHGRGAYYQEKSLGKVDGGAVVGELFLKAFADYYNSQ